MAIHFFMAFHARFGCFTESRCGVTFLTVDLAMATFQFKARFIMVEAYILPGFGRMTALTLLAHCALMFILLDMTRHAGHGS